MIQPSYQGYSPAYQQPSPPPSLHRDAVEWGNNDAGFMALEVLVAGVIVVAFLGDVAPLAFVGYLIWLGSRGLRTWMVFDPATRTGWNARGFRWIGGVRSGYDALRPSLEVTELTTRVMKAGREVNRVKSWTYMVTLGSNAAHSFKTSNRAVAEACCAWARLSVGGTLTPQQLQSAISNHDSRAMLRTFVSASTGLAALGVLMGYGFDPVYYGRLRASGVMVMAAAVAPLLIAAVVRASRIGALPRCAPVPRSSAKGWAAAAVVALMCLGAYGVVGVKLNEKQTRHDDAAERVARALAAMPDPNAVPASVAGLTTAPRTATVPTRVEGSLTAIEGQRRLTEKGFTAHPMGAGGLPGLRLWSVRADNGAGRGADAELLAPPSAALTINRSGRLVVAVAGADATSRATLAAMLQARFGGYGFNRTDMTLREALEGARYEVTQVSSVGVSTVRARRAREAMEFELIDLQRSYAPTLVADAADGLLLVRSHSGDPAETMPWTRFVMATLAGAHAP